MMHASNARADRYPVRREITTDGPAASAEVTPFCQIDKDGVCQTPHHVHTRPVHTPAWARLREVLCG
jgi:hypothetical protein